MFIRRTLDIRNEAEALDLLPFLEYHYKNDDVAEDREAQDSLQDAERLVDHDGRPLEERVNEKILGA